MEVVKKQYQQGKLYQWNGTEFVELEPSTETKIPVSVEAMEAVKKVRKEAQILIGLRPELSLTASAMLLAAAQMADAAEHVQRYGQQVYSNKANNPTLPEGEVEQGGGEDLFNVQLPQ